MTVQFMDGFDLHIDEFATGAVLAQGDAEAHWGRGATIASYDFVPTGVGTGQAIAWDDGPCSRVMGEGVTRRRIGFWARPVVDSGEELFFSIGNAGLTGGGEDRYDIRIQDEQLRFGLLTDNGSTFNLLDTEPYTNGVWSYFEIYIDTTRVDISINKSTVFSNTHNLSFPNEIQIRWNFGGLGIFSTPTLVDHYWESDGDPLGSQDILAVSISAGVDEWKNPSGGCKGHLIFGDFNPADPSSWTADTRQYKSEPVRVNANSEISADEPNLPNRMNICNYVWGNNPDTGLPWTSTDLANLTYWGLCFHDFTDPGFDGDKIRVGSICFNILRNNNGMPLIEFEPARGLVAYDGNWGKSNSNLGITAVTSQIPRPNTLLVADSDYLTATDPEGCLTFQRISAPITPVSTVGITFAEERRTYPWRDWMLISGTGSRFDSYFVSAYSVLAEGNKEFQSNYVHINYENITGAAAFVRGVWQYSLNDETNRWSQPQQIYRLADTDYQHGVVKLKVRGNGTAMQIRIESDADNPFKINGWTKFVTSDGAP